MTRYDLVGHMHSTNVSNLKAHLSEFLRGVKSGESVTIVERETPIARLIPIRPDKNEQEPLVYRKGTGKMPRMRFNGKVNVDPAALLSEDRDGR